MGVAGFVSQVGIRVRLSTPATSFRLDIMAETTLSSGELQKLANRRGDLEFFATRANSSLGHCDLVRRNYSLPKLLLESLDSPADSWEREVSDEISHRTQRVPNGFWMPLSLLAKRDLSATLAGQGEELVEHRLSDSLISVLRPMSVVLNLGGRLIENIRSPITFPRQDTTGQISWLGEGIAVTPFSGVPQFDQVITVPRRASATTTISKQLLIQSTVDDGLANLVRQDILRSLATAIDFAALDGLGAAYNQPLGILNYPVGSGAYTAVQVVSFSADSPNWNAVVAMETALQESNVLNTDSTFGYVLSPITAGIWKTTPKNSSGEYLVDRDQKVNGCRMLASTELPNTGTGSAILGKWSELRICTFGVADIVSNPYSFAGQNVVAVTITILVDVVLAHANAFCISSG
jgi:HK97 family phage major capsid protein